MMMILKSLDPLVNTKLFDNKLSQRRPVTVVNVKDFAWIAGSNNQVSSRPLQPSQMGGYIATMSGLYVRYRIIKCIFTYISQTPSTTGLITFGVSDDNGAEGGSSPQPTNAFEVLNLRTSSQTPTTQSGEVVWTPLDPEKLYYTYTASGSGADQRDTIPGTFYMFPDTPTGAWNFHMRVTIEFSGQSGDATT